MAIKKRVVAPHDLSPDDFTLDTVAGLIRISPRAGLPEQLATDIAVGSDGIMTWKSDGATRSADLSTTADGKIDAIRTDLAAKADGDGADLVGVKAMVAGGNGLTLSQFIFGLPDIRLLRLPGDTVDDAMFQRAANIGGKWNVPESVTVQSVIIDRDVHFQLNPNVVISRPANADTSGGTLTSPRIAIFDVKSNGVNLLFTGGGSYDGQEATMTAPTPKGLFIRVYITAYNPSKGDIRVNVNDMKFRNGTVGYIYSAGDNIQRRYETIVEVNDCTFYATRYGVGAGDQGLTLGYSPTYLTALDYTRLITNNLTCIFEKPIENTTQYAAVGILGSFAAPSGGTYETAGGAIISCNGLTTCIGMGRSYRKFDDSGWGNNGIGVIDGYGNIDSLTIENLYAVNSRFTTVRAKGSISDFVVKSAILRDCFRGIQVGPSSTGPCQSNVRIGKVICYNGTIPMIEFSGTSPTDTLKSVVVESCRIEGVITNPENHAQQNYGAISLSNIDTCVVADPEVLQSPISGIVYDNIKNMTITNPKVRNTGYYGIHGRENTNNVMITNVDIDSTANIGLSVQPGPNGSKFTCIGGKINNATSYGVFVNSSNVDALVTGVELSNVQGNSRGFFCAVGSTLKIYDNKADVGVTSPVWSIVGANIIERGNSWNPTVKERTALPTTGVYKVGDRVMISNPPPGASWGYVCTEAGEPGVWKSMGTVSA